MDRTIVIYKSKYGATEKYAQWIGQDLDCPVVSADDFNKKDFEKYDNIIFINFSKKKVRGITCYYCPGAYDPSKVKGMDAMIMNMMKKMLEDKKESEVTEDDRLLLARVTEGADLIDRKYIEPIVREFKGE